MATCVFLTFFRVLLRDLPLKTATSYIWTISVPSLRFSSINFPNVYKFLPVFVPSLVYHLENSPLLPNRRLGTNEVSTALPNN